MEDLREFDRMGYEKTMRLKPLFFSAVLLLVGPPCTAQQKAKAENENKSRAPASLSGKVFLVTEGGDLKPARFAHVYLLYLWSGTAPARQAKEDKSGNTAGAIFLDKYDQEMQQELIEIKDPNTPTDETFRCKRRLLTVSKALSATGSWSEESGKSRQFFGVDTDEEGMFRIVHIPAGGYMIVARGRAGANDAFWEYDSLILRPGSQVSVKLPSPETSCLNLP